MSDGYKVYASQDYVDNIAEEIKDRLDDIEAIQSTTITDYKEASDLIGGAE